MPSHGGGCFHSASLESHILHWKVGGKETENEKIHRMCCNWKTRLENYTSNNKLELLCIQPKSVFVLAKRSEWFDPTGECKGPLSLMEVVGCLIQWFNLFTQSSEMAWGSDRMDRYKHPSAVQQERMCKGILNSPRKPIFNTWIALLVPMKSSHQMKDK